MTLDKFRSIAPRLDADLKAVFEKYGLSWHSRKATIDPVCGSVRIRLEVRDQNQRGPDGQIVSPERALYKDVAPSYGLKLEWLDKPFTVRGETYRIVGLRARGRRKNVCIERMRDGKGFAASPTFVQTYMR